MSLKSPEFAVAAPSRGPKAKLHQRLLQLRLHLVKPPPMEQADAGFLYMRGPWRSPAHGGSESGDTIIWLALREAPPSERTKEGLLQLS